MLSEHPKTSSFFGDTSRNCSYHHCPSPTARIPTNELSCWSVVLVICWHIRSLRSLDKVFNKSLHIRYVDKPTGRQFPSIDMQFWTAIDHTLGLLNDPLVGTWGVLFIRFQNRYDFYDDSVLFYMKLWWCYIFIWPYDDDWSLIRSNYTSIKA